MKEWKIFWYNEHKPSNDSFDDFDRVLLIPKPTVRSLITRWVSRLCHWIVTHKILFLIICLIGIPMMIYMLLMILSNSQAFIPKEFQENRYKILLVVAHPDDECLFFAPTLRILQTQFHQNLSLIVFSRGNHVGLGEIRAIELHGSCRALNIPMNRCLSLDLPNIKDNPKVWWPEQELKPIIEEYVKKWSIDVLISFDNRGISGHLNHRAVGSAVRLLNENRTNTMIKMAYELKSVSLLRKYSSILDFCLIFISLIPRLLHSLFAYLIPFNLISSPDKSYVLLVNTPNDYMASRYAFASHRTQFSWDRHLYLLASRYMFVNELKYIEKNV